MTKVKDSRVITEQYDPISVLGSLYTLRQGHMGRPQRDRVALVSLPGDGETIPNRLNGGERQKEQIQAVISSQLIDTEEDEKRRIVRELHDGLGQLLTSINLHAQQCLGREGSVAGIPPAMLESLQAISSMTKQAIGEMRGICSALRPAILDDLGVLAAIRWQGGQITRGQERLTVTTEFEVHEAMIPEGYKTAIYRIAQEALNNTVKYSAANALRVKLDHTGDYLQLLIQDDGVGFDVDRTGTEKGGMGLTSMRERAEALGGTFELESKPGAGVEIRVLLPLEKIALSG